MGKSVSAQQLRWEHFPHGADIGVRGAGPSLERAFEQAALALTAVITDITAIRETDAISVECSAPDPELLLVDWLNAIVYEMATQGMLFGRFEVSIEGDTLRGTLVGEPVDTTRHERAVEVKGATYTELKVERQNGIWVAQCVVDV